MEHTFTAPVDKVYALLTDAKWLEARCLAMGELSAQVKVKKAAKSLTVTMQRRVHRDLPALVAKVMSSDSDLQFREEWCREGDGYAADWSMDIAGQPVKSTGRISLQPSGKGCRYAITHNTQCSIPFVGGAVAKFAQGQIEVATQQEFDYLEAASA